MCPIAQADGHDCPRLVDEAVPGKAAVIDDLVIGLEYEIGEPVVAAELPDVFDRVELGRSTVRRAQWRCLWHTAQRNPLPARHLNPIQLSRITRKDAPSGGDRSRSRDSVSSIRVTLWLDLPLTSSIVPQVISSIEPHALAAFSLFRAGSLICAFAASSPQSDLPARNRAIRSFEDIYHTLLCAGC